MRKFGESSTPPQDPMVMYFGSGTRTYQSVESGIQNFRSWYGILFPPNTEHGWMSYLKTPARTDQDREFNLRQIKHDEQRYAASQILLFNKHGRFDLTQWIRGVMADPTTYGLGPDAGGILKGNSNPTRRRESERLIELINTEVDQRVGSRKTALEALVQAQLDKALDADIVRAAQNYTALL